MSKKLTDTEILEQGLVLGTKEEAMQYYQAYKRYGTSQKHPVDAIFDMFQSKGVDDCKVKEAEPNILCGECLSKEIKKEKDLYVYQNCGFSSKILDSSLQDTIKATNEFISSLSSCDK